MHTSNNSPNLVDADFAATFTSVPDLVNETVAAAPIAEEVGLLYDNDSATGGRNKKVGGVMFNGV